MFTKPLKDIDKDDIQALVEHEAQESAELEFKRDIESTDKGKKKLAKHVSAMANANGGIIIFGIEEKDSKADKLIGIDEMVGDQPVGEFVNNVLISRVRPRLAVQPQTVKLANGKVVLVLQVSRIPYRPHMVLAENVYYVRHNCSVALADEHEVRAMVLESKSSSDEVKEFLKKRNLDDKDKEDFALTPLSKKMRETLAEVDEGCEEKPFMLFASCPHHLEERMAVTSEKFLEWTSHNGYVTPFGKRFVFLAGRLSITAEGFRCVDQNHRRFQDGKTYRYAEIFRNGYVEKGLCVDVFCWNGEVFFDISSFVAVFYAYMDFIRKLYGEYGYSDEVSIVVALSHEEGIKAYNFRPNERRWYGYPVAQGKNFLFARPVILSELGDDKIKEIVNEFVERVLNHFDERIENYEFDEQHLNNCLRGIYAVPMP